LRIGYSGLVPPGECGSSYFVYPLGGIEVGASLPLRLANAVDLKLYGSYLFTRSVDADQQITWLTFPSGIRHWRRSSTDSYTLGAEFLSPVGSGTALVGGIRWESLTTTFKDPNPEYLLTVDTMQAQVTVTMYEPYVGFRFQQGIGPGGLTVRLVGFPFFLATIQHFNTCNKDGDPLAHVGHANVSRGYFVEAAVEYRLALLQGLEASGFVAWDVYRGQVPMYLERIIIVPGFLSRSELPFNWVNYTPHLPEILITIGTFALLAFLYIAWTRIVPIIPVWEVHEGQTFQSVRRVGRAILPTRSEMH